MEVAIGEFTWQQWPSPVRLYLTLAKTKEAGAAIAFVALLKALVFRDIVDTDAVTPSTDVFGHVCQFSPKPAEFVPRWMRYEVEEAGDWRQD